MKKLALILFGLLINFAFAEPLIFIEPETTGESSKELKPLRDILRKEFPDAGITIRSIDPLQAKDATSLLPDGMMHWVSAVVVDPKTKHAVLLDFVICRKSSEKTRTTEIEN
jgi:hypothetical protein